MKKSTDEVHNFRIKKNKPEINKLPNAENRNVLASKLRPVKLFKGKKCYFTGERPGNSTTADGRSYNDKDPPLTTSDGI